ncbi:MAG: M48 family metallopeptidase [Candidatus Dojkabacteria bacterium]|nr:M48 family metallopeptidase [Candidatus Dojkabacteria bacterium]
MYSQIDKNRLLSVFLLLGFLIFAILVSWFLSYLVSQDIISSVFVSFISFGISVLVSLVTYFYGDKFVLFSTGSIDVTDNPAFNHLNKTVEILSIKAGIPRPRIYIIPDPALNAFATGRNPQNSHVAITQGLYERMNQQELEGVIAHELAHIKNFDIRLMLIVSVFASAITYIADFFIRVISGSDEDTPPWLIFIGILVAILSPIIATLIQLAISRRREYLADFTAVEITRYPQGLISALRKLQADDLPVSKATEGNAHMFIDFPLKRTHSFFANLFSTHPPIEDRIAALERL